MTTLLYVFNVNIKNLLVAEMDVHEVTGEVLPKWKRHLQFDALDDFDAPLDGCDICFIDYMDMPPSYVKSK